MVWTTHRLVLAHVSYNSRPEFGKTSLPVRWWQQQLYQHTNWACLQAETSKRRTLARVFLCTLSLDADPGTRVLQENFWTPFRCQHDVLRRKYLLRSCLEWSDTGVHRGGQKRSHHRKYRGKGWLAREHRRSKIDKKMFTNIHVRALEDTHIYKTYEVEFNSV